MKIFEIRREGSFGGLGERYSGRDIYHAGVYLFGMPIFAREKQLLAILHDKRERERERVRKSRSFRACA